MTMSAAPLFGAAENTPTIVHRRFITIDHIIVLGESLAIPLATRRIIVKKTAFGFAAALALGFVTFSLPASAMPAASGLATHAASGITTVQYRHRHMHRHRACTYRTVVSRGHHGRRIVKKVRVCR
jgi:hypothetical protein